MNNDIFYLESCLAIEKSLEEVRESTSMDVYDGFIYESSEGVFSKIKKKIMELIAKVKSIFTGKAMRKKDADAIKKAKSAKGGQIKVRDYKKLNKLYSSCKNDIKNGKDVDKVKSRWKKGLVILGFVATTAAVVGTGSAIKHRGSKTVNPSGVDEVLEECNNIISNASKELESYSNSIEDTGKRIGKEFHAKQYEMIADRVMSNEVKYRKQAQALSELYSDMSKSVTAAKNDIHSGVDKLLPAPIYDVKSDYDRITKQKRRDERYVEALAKKTKAMNNNHSYNKTVDIIKEDLKKLNAIREELADLEKNRDRTRKQTKRIESLKKREKVIIDGMNAWRIFANNINHPTFK